MSITEEVETAAQISYTYYSYEEREDGRGYIGWRKCPLNLTPQSDKYLGSATDKTFDPTAKIILSVYDTSQEAQMAEIYLHELWEVAKNPHFANKVKATSVGFSRAGMTVSEETRQKLSEAAKGKKYYTNGVESRLFREGVDVIPKGFVVGGLPISEETKQKLSGANKGKKRGEETKLNISEALRGRKLSEETKQKMSLAKQNMTEEHKQKISEAKKGKKREEHSEETKQKISEAQKGKKKSEEQKQKLSETAKARKGKKFYNNGEVCCVFREGVDEIPAGFVKGRLPKSRKS